MYAKIDLSDDSIVSVGALPSDLVGLTQASLDDMSAALDPCPAEHDGYGYWPVTIVYASITGDQKNDTANPDDTVNTGPKTVTRTYPAIDLEGSEATAALAAAIAKRQAEIDTQRDALLAAGKAISGNTLKGQIGDIGGITVARERTGRTAAGGTKNISNVTSADPGVVTANAHNIDTGTWVLFASVGGMTELNGNAYVWEDLSTNTGSLKDRLGNDIDTSGFTTYTSGGTVTPVVPFITADNTTVYIELSSAIAVADTLTTWHNNMFLQGRAHKDAVAALTTVVDVKAYDSSSWPT